MKSNLIVKVNLKDRRTVQPPVPKPNNSEVANNSEVGMESSTHTYSLEEYEYNAKGTAATK
jgi:hypothetical protein